jgi:hypothetical protein
MSSVEPERRMEKFRHTAVGTAVAAGLLGLRDALEGRPEQEETVMEAEAPGAPPPDGIELFLDPSDPTKSVVVIHPIAAATPNAPAEGVDSDRDAGDAR